MAIDEVADLTQQHLPPNSFNSNGTAPNLLSAAGNGLVTMRGRSYSNRIIRSAVRTATSTALNGSATLPHCHDMRRTTAVGTTTVAIMPTVRKLSECSISNHHQHHLHATTSCSSLLPLHEPKMMRLNQDDPLQRRCLSSHSVRNTSYSLDVVDSGSPAVSFACKSTSSTSRVSTMATSNSITSTVTSSQYINVAAAGSGLLTDLPSLCASDGDKHVRYISKIVVNPASAVTTPDTDKPSPAMTTQLSNASSGVSSMFDDEHRRRSCASGLSIRIATIGGSDDVNDDLIDDLMDIIQRDVTVDMRDEQNQISLTSGGVTWRDRRGSSSSSGLASPVDDSTTTDVFFPVTAGDRSGSTDELEYEPANMCGFESGSYAALACHDESRACRSPSADNSAALGSTDQNDAKLTELQPAALPTTTFTCTTQTTSTEIYTSLSLVTDESAENVQMMDSDQQQAEVHFHNVAAVSTPESMQMMSDNELMRMWIESLPPAHELPEPALSPRLPIAFRRDHLMVDAVDIRPSAEIRSRNIHTCGDANHHHDYRDRRYTLVLDLDETLVHAVTQALPDVGAPPDLTFPIEIVDPFIAAAGGIAPSPLLMSSNGVDAADLPIQNVVRANIMVYVRPYAIEFLRQMAQHYEVVVFTASKSEYADRVIDYLCDQATLMSSPSASKAGSSVNTSSSTSDREDEPTDDDDDAASTSSTATASPCSSTVSSHASSGYVSTKSLSPVKDVAAATAAATAASTLSGIDEIDCATALRCTESVLDEMPLSTMPTTLITPAACNSAPSSNIDQPLASLPRHEQNHHCVVKHRLYREHCVQLPFCPVYLKDLSRLGRDIERTVIVDNQLLNFALQMDNGIAVRSWHGSPDHDDELRELSKFLQQMAEEQVQDVRPYIKKSFGHLKP